MSQRGHTSKQHRIGYILTVTGIAVLICMSALAVTPASAAPTEINSCTTLTQPGEYELTSDVSSSSYNCIEITASNVIFDGQGHTISGYDDGVGIFADGWSTDVTIRDTTVTDLDVGISYKNVDNGRITNNVANGNSIGILLRSSDDNEVIDNVADSNDGGGVGGIDTGIMLRESDQNTITGNTITDNEGVGLSVSTASVGNTIYNNFFSNRDNIDLNLGGQSNFLNVQRQPGPNIVDGPFIGGNYYAHPDGTGYSETCRDVDGDDICDDAKNIDSHPQDTHATTDRLPLSDPRPHPDITVSSTNLDFGDTEEGSSATETVTIINEGDDQLEIDSASVSGLGASAFSVVNDNRFDHFLQPGESTTVEVEFAPLSEGAKSATLSIDSNDPDPSEEIISILLEGTSVSQSESDVRLSSTSLNFGSVAVGSSTTREVTITNDGNAALSVSETDISGSDAGAFSVSNGGSFSLAPSESRAVIVEFSPTSNGDKSATLSVQSTDSDEATVAVDLSGTVSVQQPEPTIAITPTTISFGNVVLDDTTAETITILNQGNAPLSVTATTISSGPDAHAFEVTGGGSFNLNPGDSQPVTIEFVPTSTGTKSATFSVQSDDPSEGNVDVTLSGTGRLAVIGSSTSPPGDPNGDLLFEDVNGDGGVNYDDVVDFFNHFEESAVQNYPEAFDFNNNRRIDYDDIVQFFRFM